MKSSILLLPAALLVMASCNANKSADAATDGTDYASLVNVRTGSGGHGHVFVGASVPFGMVQLGPTSIPQVWDWCSGYHSSDSTVIGFSHTHLEGTGIGDLFDITVMPVTGEVTYARGTEDAPGSGLWSYADRSQEIAEPGYYRVPLTRYGIDAEMTATNRVGLHRYTFPASDSAAIVFDLQNGGCWDRPTETLMTTEGNNRIVGQRFSQGWANNQKVFFVAEFSKPFESFELAGPNNLFGRASFKTDSAEQVLVKVALSPVSIEGAKANLDAELPGWDFEATKAAARGEWNKELGRIKAEAADTTDLKKFYTSLYRTMIVPSTFSDVDGNYRGADDQVHHADNGRNVYTVYSLWDTYRAEMPLLSIFQPERNAEMVNNMIDIADEQGRLPVWHLWGNETDCMVGNPGIIAVADAVVKKVPGVNPKRAFEAMLKTAADTARGGALREKYGFIPSDLMNEAIGFDMEYAIADGAVANAAKALGDSVNFEKFTQRSHSYRNYFDPSTGFVRGKMADGSFRTPFDPNSVNHRANDYTEGNAWQYTWLVPQDLDGLIECFGGKENTLEKLDLLFNTSSELRGEDVSPDISGMIGQYVHGNEPSHHIIYFYTMLGENRKAADRIRQVMADLYSLDNDGFSGNADAGQMPAWYVLSSLGFYQVEPASGRYWFGSPLLDKAEIAVPGGTFTVIAHNNSDKNRYIKSVKLNGQDYDKMYIDFADIINGGTLEFEMGD